MSLFSVITTIQAPTPAVEALVTAMPDGVARDRVLIIGDGKGPQSYPLDGTELVTLEQQLDLPWDLARLLPTGHYSRKNLGYLLAMRRGATSIYETDDDNAPLPGWAPREREVEARAVDAKGWVNAYRAFTPERIWPRGLPLDAIVASHAEPLALSESLQPFDAPIQQGLANGSPDVDAVWRLVLDREFNFDDGPSIHLPPGAWCPFNTQSTWWWPDVYPLLYIPSNCSFRMCDIWKSFVAQRCLWELGKGVVFHAPEVVQDRNHHDLMRDFDDEIPGYQGNRRLIEVLEGLDLVGGVEKVSDNLRACYQALVEAGFFPSEELALVDGWIAALLKN